MNSSQSLISCICITAWRPEFLWRAMQCFNSQTYAQKELVISVPTADKESIKIISIFGKISNSMIKVIERDKDLTIGEARNHAVVEANGEYVCMWDDDDLYSINRIEEQYLTILNDEMIPQANVYRHIILYHNFERKAYLSYPGYWACTLFCSKESYLKVRCEDKNQFEYNTLIKEYLINNALILCESPASYVHHYHGKNLLNYKFFLEIINLSTPTSNEFSTHITNSLNVIEQS